MSAMGGTFRMNGGSFAHAKNLSPNAGANILPSIAMRD